MADPVSIATGIVGLAGLAARVSLELFKLYDTIGDAKSDLSTLAEDVSGLSSTLEQVGDVVRNHGALIKDKAVQLIFNVIKRCEKTIEELRVTTDLVNSKLLYLKWLYRRTKTREQIAVVEGYKSSLNTIMTTVILAHLLNQSPRDVGNPLKRSVSSAAQRNIDLLQSTIRKNRDVLERVKQAEMTKRIDSLDEEERVAQMTFESDGKDHKPDERTQPQNFEPYKPPNAVESTNAVGVMMTDYTWQAILRQKYGQLGNEPAVATTLEEVVPERLRQMKNKNSSTQEASTQSDKLTEEVKVLLEEWTTSSAATVQSIHDSQQREARTDKSDVPAWIQERYTFVGDDVNNPDHWQPRDLNVPDVKVLPHSVFAYEQSDDRAILMDCLSEEGGCWTWRHEDSAKREYYVGMKKVVQYFMQPLTESNVKLDIKTIVSRQWISKATLEQSGHHWKEYGEGSYAILKKLTPTEVRDLHIASAERAERLLRKLSNNLVEVSGERKRRTRTVVATLDSYWHDADTLAFKQGDLLELEYEYDLGGNGWGMAHRNGKKGLIPLSLVKEPATTKSSVPSR